MQAELNSQVGLIQALGLKPPFTETRRKPNEDATHRCLLVHPLGVELADRFARAGPLASVLAIVPAVPGPGYRGGRGVRPARCHPDASGAVAGLSQSGLARRKWP